jgi:uncharacterized membrane protein HdeD (DUF308 family)
VSPLNPAKAWCEVAGQNTRTLLVLGVVQIVLGVLAITMPFVPGVALAYLAGAVVLLAGISKVVEAFKSGSWGNGMLGFGIGALAILGGLVIMLNPLIALASLTLLLGIYFLLEGAVAVALGLRIRPVKGWVWTALGGAVTLLLGVLVIAKWPLSGAWLIGTLLGVHLIFGGWAAITCATTARDEARRAEADGVAEAPAGA